MILTETVNKYGKKDVERALLAWAAYYAGTDADQTSFDALLCRLIHKADQGNRQKLREGFPAFVVMHRATSDSLMWEELGIQSNAGSISAMWRAILERKVGLDELLVQEAMTGDGLVPLDDSAYDI